MISCFWRCKWCWYFLDDTSLRRPNIWAAPPPPPVPTLRYFPQIKTLAEASITSCHRRSQSSPCALPPRLGGSCYCWCVYMCVCVCVWVVGCFLTDTTIRDCYACLSPPLHIIDDGRGATEGGGWIPLSRMQVRQAGRRGQTDCQAHNFPGEQQTLSDFHTAAAVMMSEFRPEYAQMRN